MSDSSNASGPTDDDTSVTIPFGAKFAESDQFMVVFREGMALVEDTAAYLDGEGRQDSKDLEAPTSLSYATESMRLTTRLMQLASWLLIRRAVNEGELTVEEARTQEHKVKLRAQAPNEPTASREELPARLLELIHAADRLYERIIRLDELIKAEQQGAVSGGAYPLRTQLAQLEKAFVPGEDD